MNTGKFLPSTRLGRWSMWLSAIGLLIFAGTILFMKTSQRVANTDTGQEIVGTINNGPMALNTMFLVFFLLIAGGIVGIIALIKHERAIVVWLAAFFGLVALTIFVGDAFNNDHDAAPSGIYDTACSSDSDCVTTASLDTNKPCCTTCGSEAISKKAEEARRARRGGEECANVECPIFDCYNEKQAVPRCIQGQCEIEWVERMPVE
ncbi:MAG: hypothetical protein V1907_03935 [Candidatus Kerfeldbacteria bacterium]